MQTILVNGEPKTTGEPAAELPFISVGGVQIAAEEIFREAQNHPASTSREALDEAARALVVRQLLLNAAQRLKLEADPQSDGEGETETHEEALIRALLEHEVTVPSADKENCERYYENNRSKFRVPDIYEADHILLPAAPDDAPAREAAREEATGLIEVLMESPQAFGELAASHSACSSAKEGGNLGQISRGQTVPEFERALEAMQPGTISPEPVESRYGFHIVRLIRRHEGAPLPFEQVKETVAHYLEEASFRRAVQQFISILAGEAEIKGVDFS